MNHEIMSDSECKVCNSHAFKRVCEILHEAHSNGHVPAMVVTADPNTGYVSTYAYESFDTDELIRAMAETVGPRPSSNGAGKESH